MPHLPRPLVLLEDGRGASGTARLAWGARTRHTLRWTADAVGRLEWLHTVPADRIHYGTLAYDLGLPPRARRAEPMIPQPLAELFEPEHELVVDLGTGTVVRGSWKELGGYGRSEAVEDGRLPPYRRTAVPTYRRTAVPSYRRTAVPPARLVRRSFTQPAFESAVRRVQDYIAAGDVYQVNIAVGDVYETALSAWDLYLRLRDLNPSPWMGFADFGDWQLVSGSPELLVELGGTAVRRYGGMESSLPVTIRTRPIAGTRKKTGDRAQDAAMRAELTLDEKERAEHRMLVDLARNDVGRVAAFGSVRVSEREVVEEYSHVFHLVSDVTGRMRAECSAADAVRALFPGGTITGAPKIRAMEVIAELEPVARGAYTGALGWLGPDAAQLNILIRSAVCRDGAVGVQAGAGIVWDSDPAREWRESLRKAAALRAVLGVDP